MDVSKVTSSGEWLNFSRGHQCRPARVAEPRTLEELAKELRRARAHDQRVRVIGSGHSYSDVALAPEVQLSLRHLNAVENLDSKTGLVRVQGGITLAKLRSVLASHGLAFSSMGDTDAQSIAGALSTGTHGSGLNAPAFSSQVTALQLMLADGSIIETSEDQEPDLFLAARVSLGALGVITGVTLRTIPAYFLRREDTVISREEALRLIANPAPVDHFGVWLMPYADKAMTWASTRVEPGKKTPSKFKQWLKDVVLTNSVLRVTGSICRHRPQAAPAFDRFFAKSLRDEIRVDRSDNIFIRPIHIRHNAFAYAVPLENGVEACQQMLASIEATQPSGVLPCEIRFAGSDNAWLHPQSGRQTAWIGSAMHAPGFDVATCWSRVEKQCLALEGRPHWAKWHTCQAADLARMYPMWDRFQSLRSQLDPDGLFGSPQIDRILGPVRGTNRAQ